jgi:hypothetical protein
MERSRLSLRTPRRKTRAAVALAALLGAGGAACPAQAQEYVPTADVNHPRVRYTDSLVSVNDRCIVRQGKLNPSYLPVYVNGHPIGFC